MSVLAGRGGAGENSKVIFAFGDVVRTGVRRSRSGQRRNAMDVENSKITAILASLNAIFLS